MRTIECDVCVLATGLNLRFFSFEVYVGDEKIAFERINFYKGVMVGGIPNYFHPMGSWHSAWTQRLEPVTRLAVDGRALHFREVCMNATARSTESHDRHDE